jgi:TRAP-type C4-dicarboxylate transport system permease small subunit
MVMLGIVVAFRRGALVSVDLMLRLATGAWQRTVRWVILLSSLAYLSVLVWFGVNLVTRVRFQTFASMELSMGWAYGALPVGAALAMLAVVANHLDPLNEELDNAQ